MILPDDYEARELALDINNSFIVQAPAGSGKTSLLVKRFLKLLLTVQQPEQVLALTFTKKAAGEMRQRVLDILLEGQLPLAQQVLAHSNKHKWHILQNPNRIKIKTFDSLCAFIVAKRPFLSGFGAAMNVANFAEQLYQQSVANLLNKIKDFPDYHADFLTVFKHFDNDRNRLSMLLESLLATRQQWLELVLNIKEKAKADKLLLIDYLNNSLRVVREKFISDANLALTDLEPHVLQRVLEIACHEGLLQEKNLPLKLKELVMLKDLLLTKDGTLRKTITVLQNVHHTPHKQELKKILGEFELAKVDLQALHDLQNIVPLSYSEQQINVLLALANILLLLVAEFNLQTFDKNEVDFAQIAIAASNALGHMDAPSELALELDYNLQHILVDEFQDTSEFQFKILQQLTNGWEDSLHKTIFFVGDPMQSIYRFRQANVSIFLNVKENGFNNIPLCFLSLNTNFRSTKTLVTWVNALCQHLFPKHDDYSLGAVSFSPSVAMHEKKSELSEVQGFFALEQPACVVDVINKNPGKSIAILVRARSHLPQIIKSLNQQQIAYNGVDIGLLVDKPVVQNLLTITKALLDFTDQISWLALLRLPWIGLSLNDLQIIARQANTVISALLSGCELSEDGRQRLELVKPIIMQAYFNKINLDVSSLVNFVFTELSRNVSISKTEMFEVTSYLKFISQLEHEYTTLTSQIIDSRLEALYINYGSYDAGLIQVMTIHKAKGLEFDVVIIPYLERYLQNDQSPLIIFDEQLIAHKDTNEYEPIYNYLRQKDARQNTFEAKRLLYVALTRAKSKIYLIAEPLTENKNPNKNSFLGFLGGFTSGFINFEHIKNKVVVESIVYKRLPLALLNANFQVPSDNNELVELTEVKYFDPNVMRITGIVLHDILKSIANCGIENIHGYEKFLPYIHQTILDPSYQNLAQTTLAKVFKNPRSREILSNKHQESYSEWTIVTNFKELKKNILDRAYLADDGTFWIIEYKLCEHHELSIKLNEFNKQLTRYINCVSNLNKYNKIRGAIYLLLQDKFIEL